VLLAVRAAIASLGRLKREGLERQSVGRRPLLGSHGLSSRRCHLADAICRLRLGAHLALFDLLRFRHRVRGNIRASTRRRSLVLKISFLFLPPLRLLLVSFLRFWLVNIRYQIILIHLVNLHVVLCEHLLALGW